MYFSTSKLVKDIKPVVYSQRLRKLFSTNQVNQKEVPSSAEIVIAGGGAIGSSVAYHLSKCGWKDILILEQGQVGCGSSWHAAALCGTLRKTKVQTELAKYAVDLYPTLEEETGVATGFKRCGSLNVTTTKDRVISHNRLKVMANQWGVECHVIGKNEAGKMSPLLNTDDIKMALWLPNDGVIEPTNLIQAYLKGARKDGATEIVEGIEITGVESKGKHVTAVETNVGRISCDKFINCAGLWSRDLGMLSNPPVAIPLHACEHFYVVTKPLNGVHSMMPVTHDYGSYTYFREWGGGLLGGGIEPNAKGIFFHKIPDNFHFQLLEEDWDHFEIIMDGLMHRYPCFEDAEIRQFINGPASFTPDGMPHASKSMEFANYFVAAGLNSNGIINSAGIGKCMAELITYGESEINIHNINVGRIHPWSNNKLFCYDKAVETMSGTYEQSYPVKVSSDLTAPSSPIHCLVDKNGAVWGEHAGWPRPLYFKQEENDRHMHTFGQPTWLGNVQSEIKIMENSIGILDFSSKSKFTVTSTNSENLAKFLEYICLYKDFKQMNHGDVVSTVVRTSTKSLVSCVDVLKMDENTVTVITGPEQHTFLSSHLEDAIDETKMNIVIGDVTGKYASFGLLGPNAENVLNDLLSPPFSTKHIEHGKGNIVDIGYATSVILTHYLMPSVQNAWQMLIPSQYSQGLYIMLMKAGEKYDIRNIGHLAYDSFRVRHLIPVYGSEIAPRMDVGMLESFYLNEKKTTMSLVQVEITVPTTENWPWGGEPVSVDGHALGNLTSVGYTEESDKVLGLFLSDSNRVCLDSAITIQVGEDQYPGSVIKMK